MTVIIMELVENEDVENEMEWRKLGERKECFLKVGDLEWTKLIAGIKEG